MQFGSAVSFGIIWRKKGMAAELVKSQKYKKKKIQKTKTKNKVPNQ